MLARGSWIAAVLILLAAGRIGLTLPVFAETADEATHVASGLYLWTQHRAGIHFDNPPLVRLILSGPLLLAGAKFPGQGTYFEMLAAPFYSREDYVSSLVLARMGNLLFFAIAAFAVWRLATRAIGERGGLIALLLFTMEPILLGYSGLATHDGPAVAGVAVSLLAFWRWLETTSWRRAAELGAALGFAVLCKLSCLLFVPAGCATLLGIRLLHDAELRGRWRELRTLLLAAIVAGIAVWVGYGFTTTPVREMVVRGTVSRVVQRVLPEWVPVPAPALVRGLDSIGEANRKGWKAYAFGKTTMNGWWWYFPLAVLVKTTLPLLALVTAGWFVARGRNGAVFRAMFVAGLAMLAIATPSTLNIGVRYVLPIHVAWVVAAAAAATAMIERGRNFARIAMFLLATQTVISLAAHPDYFPYFNLTAGPDPSRVLIDSNLDWGQDVLRLRDTLRERNVKSVGTFVFGSANLDALGFPPRFDITFPTAGYVAVSDHAFRMTRADGGPLWMARRPYERIGKSIRLYRIE
jgi:4-amino-4-deoxy-L-arabinose transferase-like glycosyltransferase